MIATANAQVQIDRTKKPASGPAPVITIKDPVIYKLTNGITVLVVENHKLPKVNATFSIDAGPVTEGSKAGVMNIMGQMLSEGTKTKTKAQFDELIDGMGADLGLSSGGGNVSALSRYFKDAFMLMAEALKQPAFPQESFDKIKSQSLTGLKASDKSVKAIAARATNALMYGLDHPYGEFQTEQSVNSITLADVQSAYKNYITPSRSYITFIGDIKPEEAKALAEKAFGKWEGKKLELPKLAEVPNPAKTEIDLIDMPNAVQSEINVGNLINLPLGNPDYFSVLLANQVLGGGSDGRLFLNLREKHGFTYGAYSDFDAGRYQTTFTASAAVRNEKTDSAVNEFLTEIKKMRTEKISGEDLQNAKNLYNGNFALGMENPGRMASYAMNILIYDLPKDFYRTYLQKINAVTTDDIQKTAQKYFSADNARIVVTGKASQVGGSLEKLGYPVKMYDKYAKPVSAVNTDAAALPQATTVIKDYIQAIGGIDELKKINSISIDLEAGMQGITLSIASRQMAPNKDATTVSAMGNVFQKEVFDGNGGYQMTQGNKKEWSADELKEKKAKASLFEQADYLNAGYTLSVKGIEKINGADAYKIEIITPLQKTITEYYDVKSKLLLKAESVLQENGMNISRTNELGDYRKTGNILFPYKNVLIMSAGGQEQVIDMTVKEIKLNEGVSEEDFK